MQVKANGLKLLVEGDDATLSASASLQPGLIQPSSARHNYGPIVGLLGKYAGHKQEWRATIGTCTVSRKPQAKSFQICSLRQPPD